MLRYFLNEYFMCSILHFMGYQSVRADKNLVMVRWKTYHRYRDTFIYIFQIGMVVFLVGCFAADLIIVLVYQDAKPSQAEIDYGNRVEFFVTEFTFLALRALICGIFIAAMVRLGLAKAAASKQGKEHKMRLPGVCSLSQLPCLLCCLFQVAGLIAVLVSSRYQRNHIS